MFRSSSSLDMSREPFDHLLRVRVGREHGVEDLLDPLAIDNERNPLQQGHGVYPERREVYRAGELQSLVAEELEGELEAPYGLPLVLRILRAEAEYPRT